jgi:hypothetical protein
LAVALLCAGYSDCASEPTTESTEEQALPLPEPVEPETYPEPVAPETQPTDPFGQPEPVAQPLPPGSPFPPEPAEPTPSEAPAP